MPTGLQTHDTPGADSPYRTRYTTFNSPSQNNAPTTLPTGYAGTYSSADLFDWPEGGILTTATLESLRRGTNQLAKDFNTAIVSHQGQITTNDGHLDTINVNLNELKKDSEEIANDLSNKAWDTITIVPGTGLSAEGVSHTSDLTGTPTGVNLQGDLKLDLNIASNNSPELGGEIGGVRGATVASSRAHIQVNQTNGLMTVLDDAITLGLKTQGPYVKTIQDSRGEAGQSVDIVVTGVGAETAEAKLGLSLVNTAGDTYSTIALGKITGTNTINMPSIKIDTRGRITAATAISFQSSNNSKITLAGDDVGINSTLGDFTLNQASDKTITISHKDTSTLNGLVPVGLTGGRTHDTGEGGIARDVAGGYGANHRQVKILDSVSVDGLGHVTAVTSRDITYGLDNPLGGGTRGSAYQSGVSYDLHVPTEKDFQTLRDEFFALKGGAITFDPNDATITTNINNPVDIEDTLTISDDLIVDGYTLFVDSSEDKVGINLGSEVIPTEALEVGGNTKINGNLNITSGTSGDASLTIQADTDDNNEEDNPIIFLRQDAGSVGVNMGFRNTEFGANNFGIGTRHSNTEDNEVFIIDTSNGNIGIGTNAPDELLTIEGGSNPKIHIKNTAEDDAGIKFSDFDDPNLQHFEILHNSSGTDGNTTLRIKSDDTDNIIFMQEDGDVGIGTASPSAKLDVNGNTRVGGNLLVTGTMEIQGTTTLSNGINLPRVQAGNLVLADNTGDNDDNTLSSDDTNGLIKLNPNGSGYVQVVGTNSIVIPAGSEIQRGPNVQGAIRYNTTNSQFEGYSGADWSSLGGVRSVDGLTFITAEDTPGGSDDTLHFHAGDRSDQSDTTTTTEVATLDDESFHIKNTTDSNSPSTGALIVDGGAGIAKQLRVGSHLVVAGNTTLNDNVGIGIHPAATKLQVKGTITSGKNLLGGAVGDIVNHLVLHQVNNADGGGNQDYLRFQGKRNTDTNDSWETSSQRIQRTVDVTPMGYIEFGNHNSLENTHPIILGDSTGNETDNNIVDVPRLVIDNTGNVGIGVNDPDSELEVNGIIKSTQGFTLDRPDDNSLPATTAIIDINGFGGRGAGIKIQDNKNSNSGASNREWFIGSGYLQTGFNIGYAADGNQSSYAAQAKLVITTGGNVGIGTTSPATNLQLGDGSTDNVQTLSLVGPNDNFYSSQILFAENTTGQYGSGMGIRYDSSANRMHFDDNHNMGGSPNNTIMTLDRDQQRVGIGTEAPATTLQVNGNLTIGNNNNSSRVPNYLAFAGVFGDAASDPHTVIAERIYDSPSGERSELLLFKGNDTGGGVGPDRIRHRAASHVFQTFTSGNRTWTTAMATADSPGPVDDNNTRLFIANNGNIGIGNDDPGSKLDVSGDTKIFGQLIVSSQPDQSDAILLLQSDINNDADGEKHNPIIKLRQDGGSVGVNMGFDTDKFGNNIFGIGTRFGNRDRDNSFIIDTNDGGSSENNARGVRVGIGITDAPDKTLHVRSESGNATPLKLERNTSDDANTNIVFTSGTKSWYAGKASGNKFGIGTNADLGGQAKFIINNSGQVGIGNTDPGFKLDVSGNVRFTGTLQIDGNSVKLHNTAARIKYGLWNNNDVYGIGMINGVTGGGINNDYAMTFQMNNQGARGFWFGDSSHTLAQHAMTITTQGKVNIASGLKVGYGESDTEVAGSSGINVKGDSTFVNDVAVTQNLTVNGTFGTNEGHTIDIIRDENDMASNDENALATQQSIKAYVDTEVGGIQSATFVYDNGTLTITTT